MPSEKHLYDANESLYPPIPTYEEATSSRPSSSHLGPAEASDDAERQGLLGPSAASSFASSSRRRNGYYQAPSVQSLRSSEDSLDGLGRDSDDIESPGEERELRRELEEMDVDDVEAADPERRRGRIGSRFSKRFTSLSATLSNLHLPSFSFPRPSFSFITNRIRIPSLPDRLRPSWPIIARLTGLFIVVSLIYALFVSEVFPMGRGGLTSAFNPEWVRTFAQGAIDENRIRDYLQKVTAYDHVAGSEGNLYLAKWMEGVFEASKMDEVGIIDYEVFLNYPKPGGRRVAIVEPPELAWVAKLEEDDVYDHPTKLQQQTMAFHGLSKNGTAKGPILYANYGSQGDFKALADSGIDVTGSIALVRAGGNPSSIAGKVKAAQDAGAAGCLVYSDPKEDGFLKGEPWPNGRYRTPDSLERSTVAQTSFVVGDVLTPGEPSRQTTKRIGKDGNAGLVQIPSLPLAWRDAQKLLQVVKGHGQKVPEDWEGGVPDVEEWWTGAKDGPVVELKNEQDEVDKQPIYNVLGMIEGIETKDKKIIVGNHRDSWCFGAGDPGSGTAVMLEVINVFSQLRQQGWRPLRSIYFASWDAAEYNLMGSTEFVEDHIDDLRNNALAYLNVDVGVVGDEFHAAGSPLFSHALLRVLGRVSDYDRNETVREIWEKNKKKLESFGAHGDYVPFQDLAGCSSIDMGFRGAPFPYHSCYETFEWMERYGDPGFKHHKMLAEIWVLLILELAQEPIVPFDFPSYSTYVKTWVEELEDYASSKGAPWKGDESKTPEWDIKPLMDAANKFVGDAKEFQSWEDTWYGQVFGSGGFESNSMAAMRISHNTRMSNFETHLLDTPGGYGDPMGQKVPEGRIYGVPGRTQYKHSIFGPDINNGDASAIFPAVRDAIDRGDWKEAQSQMEKAARILSGASQKLLL